MAIINGRKLSVFLRGQIVKETGMFSKGLNKGLRIAISAISNPQISTPMPQFTLCGDCVHKKNSKTVPCAYRCNHKKSPCRGRTTYADFGCAYGEEGDPDNDR